MRRTEIGLGLLLVGVAFGGSSGRFGYAAKAHKDPSKFPDGKSGSFSSKEWAIIKRFPRCQPCHWTQPMSIVIRQPQPCSDKSSFSSYASPVSIQAGTPAEGQLGAIGEKGKIACRNCHMPESKWLFDIRSNNGGAIPNATALGSEWMTRNASSIVNTVFYVHLASGAHWRENDGFSDSEWLMRKASRKVRRFRTAAGCSWRT